MDLTSDYKRGLGMIATSGSWRRHWLKTCELLYCEKRGVYGT